MRLSLGWLGLGLLFVACGGGSPPPAKSADDAPPPGADAGEDLSKVDEAVWADAGLPIPEDDGDTSSSEPEDDCTPVGVDLEKRARPKLKACYREGKKKDPNLEGTVRLAMSINTKGKITSIKITEKTLPDKVAQCMLTALKGTPFPDAPKCAEKNISIPVTFPTP